MKRIRPVLVASVVITLLFMAGVCLGAAPFYEGKTIRLIVGTSPGGGFDSYARLLARHLPKHIPGAPTIVVPRGALGGRRETGGERPAPRDGIVSSVAVGVGVAGAPIAAVVNTPAALTRLQAIEDPAILRSSAALLGLLQSSADEWFRGGGGDAEAIEARIAERAVQNAHLLLLPHACQRPRPILLRRIGAALLPRRTERQEIQLRRRVGDLHLQEGKQPARHTQPDPDIPPVIPES